MTRRIVPSVLAALLICTAAFASGPPASPSAKATLKDAVAGVGKSVESFTANKSPDNASLAAFLDSVELTLCMYPCLKEDKDLKAASAKALSSMTGRAGKGALIPASLEGEALLAQRARAMGLFMHAYHIYNDDGYRKAAESLAPELKKDGAKASALARARAALAMLSAYRATGEQGYLDWAEDAAKGFLSPGKDMGFDERYTGACLLEQCYQATGAKKYLMGAMALLDGYVPTAAAVGEDASLRAVLALVDLHKITGREKYARAAEAVAGGIGGGKEFSAAGSLARYRLAGPSYELIVIGKRGGDAFSELVKKAYMFDEPCRVVLALDPAEDAARIGELGYEYEGRPMMYVCTDRACFPPVAPGETMKKTKQNIEQARKQEGEEK